MINVDDASDDDSVIPTGKQILDNAVHDHCRSGEPWLSGITQPPVDLFKLRWPFLSERESDILLSIGGDMDEKATADCHSAERLR